MIKYTTNFNDQEFSIIKDALKFYIESMTEDYTENVDDFKQEIKLLKTLL
jgi:uncharacterized protein YeeX (DUF496 family)